MRTPRALTNGENEIPVHPKTKLTDFHYTFEFITKAKIGIVIVVCNFRRQVLTVLFFPGGTVGGVMCVFVVVETEVNVAMGCIQLCTNVCRGVYCLISLETISGATEVHRDKLNAMKGVFVVQH